LSFTCDAKKWPMQLPRPGLEDYSIAYFTLSQLHARLDCMHDIVHKIFR